MKTDNENLASIENEATKTAEKKTPLKHKRIELIGLTFLLVAGILLKPIRLTQNEAKAAEPLNHNYGCGHILDRSLRSSFT